MGEKTGDNEQIITKRTQSAFSPCGMLELAGALVVVLALVMGFNVGGLRERVFAGLGTPRIESLAVLPLENLSHDPAQDYFARGLTSTLTMDMQRIGTFRVIAPTSAAKYERGLKPISEIARELNVDAIVEGGVERAGDRVRIVASLVHAPANRRLWQQTYERDLRDIVKLEGEISRAIALAIRAELTPQQEARLTSRRPVNPQAHDAFLRAWWAGNPAKTEEYLKQAIQLDPEFASPYDYLSSIYYMKNMFPTLAPGDTYPKAKETAQRALSLDPNRSSPHRVLAGVALEYDWNFVEAEKEFKLALEFAPYGMLAHHYYAHFLLSMGRMEEAAAESRRAIEIDPSNSGLLACVGWHEIAVRNYDEAEKRSLQALGMGAPDQLARLTLGWSYALRGRHDEAVPEFQKAVVGWQGAVFPTAALGHAYAVAGKESAAREVLDKLLARSKTEYVSPYEIAVIYAGLDDDRDRAFEWLEKAYEERASFLVYFRMDPRIWSLRSDARFQELLRRMKFLQNRLN